MTKIINKDKKIICASNNFYKLKEIKDILEGFKILSLSDVNLNNIKIIENGKTFFDNALIKAKTIFNLIKEKLPVLADDSGLCVNALNGEPGVHSKRYAQNEKNNIDFLLKNLESHKDRKAKFVCCMVIYYENDKFITTCGETFGEITKKPIGQNGFAYDSIFFSNELKKTFGEATDFEKNEVSHRKKALDKLKLILL